MNAITSTDERTQKLKSKLDLVRASLKALNDKYDVYRLDKKRQLKKKIQNILFQIFTASESFKEFTIDDNYDYDVINQNGDSWKRNLSNGQRKLLSVSFVAGLKNVANEDAPYVIDSPLNAVDEEHQKNYAKILPDLSTQLILFILNDELTKETDKILRPKIGKEININYKEDGQFSRSHFEEKNC